MLYASIKAFIVYYLMLMHTTPLSKKWALWTRRGGYRQVKGHERSGARDDPHTRRGVGDNSRSQQEARLQPALPGALAGCRSFMFPLLLFIFCLVFAEAAAATHTH